MFLLIVLSSISRILVGSMRMDLQSNHLDLNRLTAQIINTSGAPITKNFIKNPTYQSDNNSFAPGLSGNRKYNDPVSRAAISAKIIIKKLSVVITALFFTVQSPN